jgi:hypothetical protein
MKANERRSVLSDIRLVFCPKSITFNRAKDGTYRLYLEKSTLPLIQMSRSSIRSPKSLKYEPNSPPTTSPMITQPSPFGSPTTSSAAIKFPSIKSYPTERRPSKTLPSSHLTISSRTTSRSTRKWTSR